MAETIAQAVIEYTSRGYSTVLGQLGNLKSSFTGALGDVFTSATGLGGILTAGALGAGLAFSVKAFGEDERAARRLEQAINATGGAAGFTADELKTLATDLQKVTEFADETTNEASAVLTTFQNIRGETFSRSLVASMDLAAAKGMDLTASVQTLGKALNSPGDGLSRLAKQGIVFTEAEEKMIASLVEGGKVAEAQAEILKKVEGAYGGQAQSQATTTTLGSLQRMKNAIGDLGESLGSVFAGPLTSFFSGTAKWLMILNNSWALVWEIFKDSATLAFMGVWDTAGNTFVNLYAAAGGAVSAMIDVLEAFWRRTKGIFQSIYEVAKGAFVGIWEAMKAVWAGESPIAAFKENFTRGLEEAGRKYSESISPDSLADKMANSYDAAFKELGGRGFFDESDAQKVAREELQKKVDELMAAADEKVKSTDELAKTKPAGGEPEGAKGLGKDGDKSERFSISDLAKNIQQGLFSKAHEKAAIDTAEGVREINQNGVRINNPQDIVARAEWA